MDSSLRGGLTIAVRLLQIIVGAMAFGCAVFLGVAALAVDLPAPSGPPVLTYVALGLGAMTVAARLAVPGLIARAGRRTMLLHERAGKGDGGPAEPDSSERGTPPPALVRLFFTHVIVCAAMLEGAGFLLVIGYMIERSPVALAAAVGAVLLLGAHVPTESSAARWIENQSRRMEEERQFAWRE